MTEIHARELVIAVCLSAFLAFINGCAGTATPIVDVKTAGDSVLNARDSLALAHSAEAHEFAPQEYVQAESLLSAAQEKLEKGKRQEAVDLAFQANVEAKIATAITREAKAKLRAAEIIGSKPGILWETKIDELAAARARQAIAQKKAIEARKEAEEAKAQADDQIQRSKAELATAKAGSEIGLAEEAKAPIYAEEAYNRAISSIQTARSALADNDFQKAMVAAEDALKYASNASVQTRAKREAELQESLRVRDRSIAARTKAEMVMAEVKDSLAGPYARDMYEKAEKLLEEVRLALENREYDRAESLAEQAQVSASNAMAMAESEERETQVREAQEDAQANALDALARAERSLTKAQEAEAEEHAGDTYRKSEAALQRANQAIRDQDFESAISLAQESISHSVTALTMAEAKTERLRRIQEIEAEIMEAAGKIADTNARETNRGVVISMGGALFAKGSSQIRNEAKSRLKTLAEILKKYSEYKIVIEGHTDSIGSDESNLKISRQRADNFLMHLVDQEGMPLERLSSVGYGESRPIASNMNEAGRRQNRRVDVVILTAPVSP